MMMMMMMTTITMTAPTRQEGMTARKIPATDPAKNVRQLVMKIRNLLTMYFSRPSLYRIPFNVLLLQQGFYILSKTNTLDLSLCILRTFICFIIYSSKLSYIYVL